MEENIKRNYENMLRMLKICLKDYEIQTPQSVIIVERMEMIKEIIEKAENEATI